MNRQPTDKPVPTVIGKSKVTKVTETSPSLKTSIPQEIATNAGIEKGDILLWRLDFVGEDKVLTIEKGEKKE